MSAERLSIIKQHLFLKPTSGYSNQKRIYDSEFKYTVNNSLLSQSQREFYEENGYIVIPGLLEESLIDEMNQRFIDICEGKVEIGFITMMKDISSAKDKQRKGQANIYKLQDIIYDDIFIKYFQNDKILDMVECFTGPNIMAMHTMYINKPPDSGSLSSRHPAHQDLYYFPFRPADRIVAAWTACEEITEDNGCLFVLPGTHKGELLNHDYPEWEGGINKAFFGVIGYDNYPKSYLPMSKGDTVFFHPLLIHGSGYNKTKGFRKAISGHYAASECDYIDIKGTVQEKMASEITGIIKSKGIDVDIQGIWRYRNRLVRGNEVNL